jgi:uncharacterized cupin superfamily protein
MTTQSSTIPPDDVQRNLALARPNEDQTLSHIGLAGDTYTILLFTILEGEIEFTFRGAKSVVRAGETANIPANAPHQFRNSSERSARLLCMCSPAGQEEYFMAVGVPVASRVSPPPKLDEAAQAALKAKAEGLASQYRTEFLHPPV